MRVNTIPSSTLESVSTSGSAFRVALVSMPFISFKRPSIQLGLLTAALAREQCDVTSFHFYLDFVAGVRRPLYDALAHIRRRLTGDWLFSVAAFGSEAPDPHGEFLDLLDSSQSGELDGLGVTREGLIAIRNEWVPSYLDALMREQDWNQFSLVGFTTTFQQNVASLALARRLKESYPHIKIVFGGANCEGAMGIEILRSMPQVDYVVDGEGEEALLALVKALREGSDCAYPTLRSRLRSDVVTAPRLNTALDALPTPDYTEYFSRAERLGLVTSDDRHLVSIPYESARGCWWGAKHHCTFCGLNGATIGGRSKSATRVYEELAELARGYGSYRLEAVDNILSHEFHTTLLPQLIESKTDYDLFYEVKANMTRAQVRQLRLAGIRRLQPGIESFSTPVLRLMKKGISGIQNVNFLRWARYYDIRPLWNILWGFPGEQESDYRAQEALLPRLVHLKPPQACGRIWLERFSPLFTERERLDLTFYRPDVSYQYIYPSHVDAFELAYFFEYEFRNALPDDVYTETQKIVARWQDAWDAGANNVRPSLLYWNSPGCLRVEDARDPTQLHAYTFDEPLASLYLACVDEPRTTAGLDRAMAERFGNGWIEEALNNFVDEGLLMRDEGRYLSLALPATPWRG